MNPPSGKWRLISRADDPNSAREYEGAVAFQAALQVANDLGAIVTWDEAHQKLYTKPHLKPNSTAPPVAGVVYPSGSMAERHPDNNDPRYAPARPGEAAPLVRSSPDIKVSPNFRLSEFRPQSSAYDGVRVHPGLVELLERIRSAAGCPIRITSGYRPPEYNREVGGVSNSLHLDGLAADIYAESLTTAQLHAVCQRVMGASGGLGYYPSAHHQFCHVDIGAYSRWTG